MKKTSEQPKEIVTRCPWCGDDPIYVKYHDKEWGRPLKNSRKLFELLILEGAQAGLSWITILKRRESYRRDFDKFDAETFARYG
jgi:DNA-3-methyladenine glycosylase I